MKYTRIEQDLDSFASSRRRVFSLALAGGCCLLLTLVLLTMPHPDTTLAQGGVTVESAAPQAPVGINTTDPLSGNYQLVPWGEVVTVWNNESHASSSQLEMRVFDVSEDLTLPSAANSMHNESLDATTEDVAVAAGDFRGVGAVGVVSVWRDGQTVRMNLCHGDQETLALTCDETELAQGVSDDAAVLVAAGDFDGDGQDDWVVKWSDKIRVYTLDTATDEVALLDELTVSASTDCIAVGDFNPLGDTTDEIVLGREFNLFVTVVNITVDVYALRAGELVLQDSFDLGYDPPGNDMLSNPGAWAIVADNFAGDAADEIVLIANFSSGIIPRAMTCGLSVDAAYQVSEWSACAELGWGNTELASGDFNADGIAEVVMAGGDDLELFAYEGITLTSQVKVEGLTGQALALSVGDLDRDALDEIALSAKSGTSGGYQTAQVATFKVATDLTGMTSQGSASCLLSPCELPGCNWQNQQVAIAVADLDDDGFQVGPPTYYREVDVLRPLAIINEPPKHYDVIDGVEHNLNKVVCNPQMSNCGYAAYETTESQATKLTLKTTRDWGVSSELTVGFEAYGNSIETSMSASYGEHFEKTHSDLEQFEFRQQTWAANDDVIFRLEVDYDIWEYPIYTDTTHTVAGYLLVVFPGEPRVARIDGKNLSAFYVPNHENNNLLSYPADAPSDLGEDFYKPLNRTYVGANTYEVSVERTQLTESSVEESNTWGIGSSVKASAGGSFLGGAEVSLEVSGSYEEGEMQLHELSIEESTRVHIYIPALDLDPDVAFNYTYWVDPYVYWSANGDYLVVDYAAGPNTEDVPIWWQETYGSKPDPTFNLPWKYSGIENYAELTKEIFFDYAGDTPQVGDPITVTAKVRNYSLMGAYNVKVRFYQGDPDAGGVQIGSDKVISQLNPRAIVAVQTTFDFATDVPNYWKIYAVVDPDNEIAEIHEDFNRAYALLMRRTTYHPDLRPESMALSSPTPAAGETLHMTTTVRALTDTATFVSVEFWDGTPGQGTVIGDVILPEIPADQSAQASIAWDTTGKFGTHQIWTKISSMSGEERPEDVDNNTLYQSVSIAGADYRVYLPLAMK